MQNAFRAQFAIQGLQQWGSTGHLEASKEKGLGIEGHAAEIAGGARAIWLDHKNSSRRAQSLQPVCDNISDN